MKIFTLSPTFMVAALLAGIATVITLSSCSSIAEAKGRATSSSHGKTLGVGIVLGEPSGFTGKYWLTDLTAIDGTIAYSFNSFFLGNVDFLYHFPGMFADMKSEFLNRVTLYAGIGGTLFISSNTGSGSFFNKNSSDTIGGGVRVPLGAEYPIDTMPITFHFEMAPGMGIFPSTFFNFQIGIGARYYFN